jgi:hypothetical protein
MNAMPKNSNIAIMATIALQRKFNKESMMKHGLLSFTSVYGFIFAGFAYFYNYAMYS